MKKRQIIKLAVIVLVFGAIVFFGFHGFAIGIYRVEPLPKQVNLGLDLTGGVYAVYEADQGDFTEQEFSTKMDSTVTVLRNRLDEKGYLEATIVRQGTGRIRVEIPINDTNQVDDPSEITAFISDTGLLEFCDVNGETQITGADVKSAGAYVITNRDGTMENAVVVVFYPEAAEKFAEMTRESYQTGASLDIKLDGKVISSPIAQQEIAGGTATITGGSGGAMSAEDAQDLAIKIESGALPLVLKEMQSSTISASLGGDALSGSMTGGLVGLLALFIFLLLYYRLPGFVACIALSVNLFLTILLFASIPSIQMTLPGIAGIILGLGMAVDANVIIFERFKEELAAGKQLRPAMKAGFHKAMGTILDSNVATLISGVVIAFYGVGTIKGFGITLIISIIISMITAVVLTRWLMNIILDFNIHNMRLYTIRRSDAEVAQRSAALAAARGGEGK